MNRPALSPALPPPPGMGAPPLPPGAAGAAGPAGTSASSDTPGPATPSGALASDPRPAGPDLPFSFTASGEEYFRIWIVNLTLTILTLGIYSAWAKVRREKYFHQHTRLAGTGFDYHGRPGAILRGRLLAVGLLGITQADFLGPWVTWGSWGLLALLLPWLMQRSLRFRLANTSYRGLRMAFSGHPSTAYALVIAFALLALGLVLVPALILARDAGPLVVIMIPVACLIVYPLFQANWRHYAIDNSHYGSLGLSTALRARDFLAIYLAVIALWFLLALPAIVLVAAIDRIAELGAGRGYDTRFVTQGSTVLAGALAYCMASSIWPSLSARLQNLTWGSTRLDGHQINSRLDALRFARLQLKNLLLTVVTLGLYRPFAVVATAHMRVAAVSIQFDDDLRRVLAGVQAPEQTAVGAETLDIMGFDIAF